MAPKRRTLSLLEKVQLLKQLDEKGETQASVSAKWKVSRTSVTKMVAVRSQLEAELEEGSKRGKKRKREAKFPEIAEPLFVWFKEKRAQGVLPSGSLLKQKAADIASSLKIENFTPNDGWFTRWKDRHGIAFKQEHGENKSADCPAANTWLKEKLPGILAEFKPENIYNADETGLFYKLLDSRGYVEAKEKADGGKQPKDRLTILVCANMDGSEKRPLLVIGKAKRPRCFPKDLSKLPVTWESSKNAWMTASLFEKWLQEWDTALGKQKRKICLLLDNCSAHPKVVGGLKNIRMEFLPANTTSIMQPMDMGIIRNLKGHYRAMLLTRIIALLDNDATATADAMKKKVDTFVAVTCIAEAWDRVNQSTVGSGFKKGGFLQLKESEDVAVDTDVLGDVEIPPDTLSREEFGKLLDADSNIQTFGELTTAELVQPDEDADSDGDAEIDPPSSKQAAESLDVLRRYLMSRGMGVLPGLQSLERDIQAEATNRRKQSKISDFFKV